MLVCVWIRNNFFTLYVQFMVIVQSLSCVWLLATPWNAACQASLSFIISWSLLKLMSIESVVPSNHFILCHPLLFLPSVLPSIRVFFNESTLRFRSPNYWSFSFSVSPSNDYSVHALTINIVDFPFHGILKSAHSSLQEPECVHLFSILCSILSHY